MRRKTKEEVEKRVCLNIDLAGTLGKVVLDASKEKNIGLVAKPSQDTNPKMNEEDGVISQPLEDTTEMISEHLESTVDVDDVVNILNLTKENINFSKERRKNTTVISSSRNSIDTEEMDILNDSDSIKNRK